MSDRTQIELFLAEGHTEHCAKRLVWGDGQCGCGHPLQREQAPAPPPTTIREWQVAIHQYAKEKGWWDAPRPFGDLCSLFHSEISEAFEEYRNHHGLAEVYMNPDKPGKAEGIPVELADCMIRIFDFCEHEGIDLQAVLEQKHAYNLTRAFRHGGKAA